MTENRPTKPIAADLPSTSSRAATPVPYYEDGQITVYRGDCRAILPTLAAVDLVLTDPPYGVSYVSNRTAGRGVAPITNDGARISLRLYREVMPLLQANHVLWFTRWDAWPDVWGDLGQWFPLRGLLVWDKGSPGMGDLSHWGMSYELIASAGAGKLAEGRDSSILRFAGVPSATRLHPTEKPVALLRYLIQSLGARTVLDPFMGSGSTLEAARDAGAHAIGIEIDHKNCDRAVGRLAQGTLTAADLCAPQPDHLSRMPSREDT